MYKKKILAISFLFSILAFSCFNPCYTLSSYVWSDSSSVLEATSNNTTDLNLQSDGAILIEQSTGQVLYEHNSHEMYRPASVTKVMSLLLIMEALDNRSDFSF